MLSWVCSLSNNSMINWAELNSFKAWWSCYSRSAHFLHSDSLVNFSLLARLSKLQSVCASTPTILLSIKVINNYKQIKYQPTREEKPIKYKTTNKLIFIDHLKMKHRLLYLKTQFIPRSKHFASRLQKNKQFMVWHKSLFVLRYLQNT